MHILVFLQMKSLHTFCFLFLFLLSSLQWLTGKWPMLDYLIPYGLSFGRHCFVTERQHISSHSETRGLLCSASLIFVSFRKKRHPDDLLKNESSLLILSLTLSQSTGEFTNFLLPKHLPDHTPMTGDSRTTPTLQKQHIYNCGVWLQHMAIKL